MKLGYILLAHEPFEKLRPLLDVLTANDDVVALHYDLKTPHHHDIRLIEEHYPNVVFAEREMVEWGESSIVKATLNGMNALLKLEEQPEYVTLLSGSCFPIQSRETLVSYLEENRGCEFVECVDIRKRQWVKAGLQSERWELFHYLNWRKTPRLFGLSEKIQRRLGVKRKFPFGDVMYMGSQWWTLSMAMIRQIVETTERNALFDFARTTWIPDEFFFQTLVGNLVAKRQQIKPPLMNYRFNDTGIPKIYTHHDELELATVAQANKFFTRKVKHGDAALLETLSEVYRGQGELASALDGDKSDSMEWYKCEHFKHWIGDYPLPVVVLIEEKGSATLDVLKARMKQDHPDFHIYGELLAEGAIDYGDEACLPNYGPEDVALRDYDWQEFMLQVAIASPTGFAFQYNSRKLNGFIDSLKYADNVVFVDLVDCAQVTLEDIRESKKLRRYLNQHACKHKRITADESERLVTTVQKMLQSNLYLRALAAQSKG